MQRAPTNPQASTSASPIPASEKSGSTNIRVIVRIRPMNSHETQSGSRVCIVAEKPNAGMATPQRSNSVVSSLLERLSSTLTSPSRPNKEHNPYDDEDVVDHGILVDNGHQLTPLNGNGMLSPHYSSSSLRTAQNGTKTILVEHGSAPARRFTVDQVLSPSTTQEDAYRSVGDVSSVFRGYNVTILAYGQTSAGKTHTMMGKDGDGVIPVAVADLFAVDCKYSSISLSCLEIYQDELKDLLLEPTKNIPELKLRDSAKNSGVEVRGLTSVKVKSPMQVLTLIADATDRRRIGSNRLNERSSRSHMVTVLSVKNASLNPPVSAKLTLVDLAGSERIQKTGVTGSAMGESIQINTDLFTLGKVVNALCEKNSHVPYRDSKLTRLLKDALGGNCKTSLICCVSPSNLHIEESINTLRYAERARSITNRMEINTVVAAPSPYEVSQLRAENKSLRAQLFHLQKQMLQGPTEIGQQSSGVSPHHSKLSFLQKNVHRRYPDLDALLEKVKQANELGKEALESSQSSLNQTVKQREQVRDKNMSSSMLESTTFSSPLEYELSLGGDDEDSLVDYYNSSTIVTDYNYTSLDVEALGQEKNELQKLLQDLSNQIESKQDDLEQLEDDYKSRLHLLRLEHECLAIDRDELAKEVSQTKNWIHLLTTKDQSTLDSSSGLRGIFRRDNTTSGPETVDIENGSKKVKETESMALARDLAMSLGEERTQRQDLEVECKELKGQLEQSSEQIENLIRARQTLQDEVNCLRQQLDGKLTPSTTSRTSSENTVGLEGQEGTFIDEEDNLIETPEPADSGRCEVSSDRQGPQENSIILQVEGIESAVGSISSCGTELMLVDSISMTKDTCDIFDRNVSNSKKYNCESAFFSCNDEQVEFYLPILGGTSNSEKQPKAVDSLPLSLENILRPWQVDFMKSVGITSAAELVQYLSPSERGDILAKNLAKRMRVWRKKKCMMSVRTKSCRVALHVWHKTCALIIQDINQQHENGVTEYHRPEFLEITMNDNATVSTLGGGSICKY